MAATGKRLICGGQIQLSAAYMKVARIEFNDASGDEPFYATINVFRDRACRDANMPPIDCFNYRYPYVPGLDPKQAAYLKLPYVDGVDGVSPVLEADQSLMDTPAEFIPKPPEEQKVELPAAPAEKPAPAVV